MSFLYPGFLAALGLIAIPIIIHLFNFRRYKTVYFTNVQFLREVKEQTTTRSRLKHLLVLAARILAIIFMVLAFAQPFIPVAEGTQVKEGVPAVSIFLDNSFSMAAENNEEPLLNRAKSHARDIAMAFPEDTRFTLLTNDFEMRHQRFVSREELLSWVDEVQLTPRVHELDEVLALQKKLLLQQDTDNRKAYWVSDFQKSIVNFEQDTALDLTLLPTQPLKQQNVYIDSCWLERPIVSLNEPNQLLVRITNTGESAVESARLTLEVNGQVKALADYTVQAQANVVDTLNFTLRQPGWQELKVNITDYPVTFDDNFFLTFNVREEVRVLAINEGTESDYLKALFPIDEKFTFDNSQVNRLSYSELGSYNLIILNNLKSIPSGLASELESYLQKGGAVSVFPAAKADINSYNQFLTSVGANTLAGAGTSEMKVSKLNEQHPIFNDVFESVPENVSLPKASLYYTFNRTSRSAERPILNFRNGASFLGEYRVNGGLLYLCASPLDKAYADFPVHAIFVPVMYKMALSGGAVEQAAYVIGRDNIIEINRTTASQDAIYHVQGGETEFIPRQQAFSSKTRLTVGNEIEQAGIYSVLEEEAPVHYFAMNYNRTESELAVFTPQELEEQFESPYVHVVTAVESNISDVLRELDRGIALWKVCIILALVFIAAEVLLLRLMPT